MAPVTLEELRTALARPRPSRWDIRDRVPSAVCVPLVARGDDIEVWIIRRPDGMRHHARELAFPGGKADPGDATLLATALREMQEELGVPRTAARLLGRLTPIPPYTSRFVIHPFAVAVDAAVEPELAPAEVAQLIRAPIAGFFDGRVSHSAIRLGEGSSPIFGFNGARMYGASAHILLEVLDAYGELAGAALPQPEWVTDIPWA